MKATRKHYRELANLLGTHKFAQERGYFKIDFLIDDLMYFFKKNNSSFDKDKFKEFIEDRFEALQGK